MCVRSRKGVCTTDLASACRWSASACRCCRMGSWETSVGRMEGSPALAGCADVEGSGARGRLFRFRSGGCAAASAARSSAPAASGRSSSRSTLKRCTGHASTVSRATPLCEIWDAKP
eukprot:1187589-Prorocentrum_minimum.AAC.2